MSIVAIVPSADLATANTALANAGHGPQNFSVPAWSDASPLPTFAALHAWDDPAFVTAIKAVSNVVWEEDGTGTPPERTAALIADQGATWGTQAPTLPDEGTVQPGLYQYGDDGLRIIIQVHDRSTYGGDPASRPALARVARDPRQVTEWKQPIDQFDAYQVDTGFSAERVTHNGKTWVTTVANNVWEPGTTGSQWDEVAP